MSQVTGAPGPADEVRRGEIRAGLRAVRARIAAACQAAGRSPADVTLIAITKTRPASDIRLLSELGVTDVGENRAQEAAAKAAECAALGLRLTWHFVGQLQVNKAASVASYADVIHSVDRLRLVSALGSRAAAAGRCITCLVQVSLDGDPDRGGVAADQIGQIAEIADAIASAGQPRPRRGDGRGPARGPPGRRIREARRGVPQHPVRSSRRGDDFGRDERGSGAGN